MCTDLQELEKISNVWRSEFFLTEVFYESNQKIYGGYRVRQKVGQGDQV